MKLALTFVSLGRGIGVDWPRRYGCRERYGNASETAQPYDAPPEGAAVVCDGPAFDTL